MDEIKIQDKLKELFEKYRIIFWNDSEQEFTEIIDKLDISDVDVIFLEEVGQFQTKYLLEHQNPEQKYLLYSRKAEPKAEDDWLLDIRLYSYQFRADSASIITEELGLQEYHLVNHIRKRISFFANKEQYSKLKELINPKDYEREIDCKMIAVCAGSKTANPDDILYALFCRMAQKGGLEIMPDGWHKIERYQLTDIFWEMMFEKFSYKTERPNLKELLLCLFVTDFSASLHCECPASLKQFLLDSAINASILLDNWRDSQIKMPAYESLSQEISGLLKIEGNIDNLSFEQLQDAQTFFVIEKILANQLKVNLLNAIAQDLPENVLTEIEEYARKRIDMYWANPTFQSNIINRNIFASIYNAIINAVSFVKLKKNISQTGFSADSPEKLFKRYTEEYYQLDQLYRLFHEYMTISVQEGWNILKGLGNKINDIYENWFLYEINSQWEQLISPAKWQIKGTINQYRFFNQFPEGYMGQKKSTVFVIISDALRFEVAEELHSNLNKKYRQVSSLDAMLGVLPSYTQLGMAALLPYKELSYDSEGEVLVNGERLNSLEKRNNHLSKFKGAAVRADDLLNMKREDAREFIKDKQIVYIYHNKIDAIGDDAKTEERAFEAARGSLNELEKLIAFVINTLLAHYVFVTADHGFIFTKRVPDVIDKYKISDSVDKKAVLKMNKRYILGHYIPAIPDTIQGRCADTAGMPIEKDINFIIPKGMSRFYFTGGARFMHGGMSLQEIAVPVITVTQVRGKEKERTRKTTVGIQILGNQHRVTTEKYRVQLLQLNAISERVEPVTVKVAIYDDELLVSDIKTVTFDSSSNDLAERQKDIILTLQNRAYDHNKNYRLAVREVNSNIEICAVVIRINRSFISDF